MALETERSERLAAAGGLAVLRTVAGEGVSLLATFVRSILQGSRSAVNGVTGVATSTVSEFNTHARIAAKSTRSLGAAARDALNPLRFWFHRQPLVRFVSASLLRRILVSNLIGFFALLLGILYLGWYHTWC
jgi:hypothetical protein